MSLKFVDSNSIPTRAVAESIPLSEIKQKGGDMLVLIYSATATAFPEVMNTIPPAFYDPGNNTGWFNYGERSLSGGSLDPSFSGRGSDNNISPGNYCVYYRKGGKLYRTNAQGSPTGKVTVEGNSQTLTNSFAHVISKYSTTENEGQTTTTVTLGRVNALQYPATYYSGFYATYNGERVGDFGSNSGGTFTVNGTFNPSGVKLFASFNGREYDLKVILLWENEGSEAPPADPIEPVCVPVPTPPPPEYLVKAWPEPAHHLAAVSTHPDSGGTWYPFDTQCTVEILGGEVETPGWRFVRWCLDGKPYGSATAYTITVTGPSNHMALYERKAFTITVTEETSGSCRAQPLAIGSITPFLFESTAFTRVYENEGYRFVRWNISNRPNSVNLIDETYQEVEIKESATWTAITRPVQYRVTFSIVGDGGGSISYVIDHGPLTTLLYSQIISHNYGEILVDLGGRIDFRVTPDADSEFVIWSHVDGNPGVPLQTVESVTTNRHFVVCLLKKPTKAIRPNYSYFTYCAVPTVESELSNYDSNAVPVPNTKC